MAIAISHEKASRVISRFAGQPLVPLEGCEPRGLLDQALDLLAERQFRMEQFQGSDEFTILVYMEEPFSYTVTVTVSDSYVIFEVPSLLEPKLQEYVDES